MADDQRASDVIRQLRTLLKKGEFLPQPLDVNELLQEVRKLMNFELTARWVSVVTQFTGGLPPVRGDQVQLQQVLINLMLNASEAMTQMPVGARAISLRSNQGTNGTVQISVADTGSGIPAGNEEKIFEAYHTTKPQGLGLGLSLSRSIIVAHGGRMWAENQANGGAVFHFTLPEWTGNPP
jgi:two-component system sensor kinase FixL